ncbi:PDF receptor-like [Oratosquilla oratoria]|uniref:PDF receptor-like n=1 Tax=Oratosquilla oratoria TaxID=337810 RepID=UPI003F757459
MVSHLPETDFRSCVVHKPCMEDWNATIPMFDWSFLSQEQCEQYYNNITYPGGDAWCNATWDGILCWPPTPRDTEVPLSCPPGKGIDPNKYAYRKCSSDGQWEGRRGREKEGGWSNYNDCFLPTIKDLMDKLYAKSDEDAQMKLHVAEVSRIMEMVGLSISLATVLLSLFIFTYFRSLRNNRTKIHRNLFVAMKIQLLIRLTLYIDQYITRQDVKETQRGIDNTPVVCEGFYVLLEYARTAMFLWMFIEGMYLHNMVTLSVFHDKPNYRIYYLIGWGLPVVMTAVWAAVTAFNYTNTACWWGYNLSPYFWILEGPRLTVIFTNLLFLLNIMRVLITKLQASVSSESLQVKKAVRAAIVLLPLLGITNSLQMIPSPLDRNIFEFAAWSYATTFLTAFQGFFIALIYCFLNNEVRATIRKSWDNYNSQRCIEENRRHSLASFQMYRITAGKRGSQVDCNGSMIQDVQIDAV